MASVSRKQYSEVIHSQVSKSFQRLTDLMDLLSSPVLAQHCKIWKMEKGAKKLIQLAIEGDRFLAKESKSLKKSLSVIHQENEDKINPPWESAMEIQNKKEEDQPIYDKIVSMDSQIVKKQEIFYQSSGQVYGQSQQIKKQATFLKKQEQNYQQSQPGHCLGSFSFGTQRLTATLRHRLQRKKKNYMRGPYKNYPRAIKEQMVQLYRTNAVPISKLSVQFGVPIKNIKRWAQNGIDRKEGAGRKRLDPELQQQLYNKIRENYPNQKYLQVEEIKLLALNLSKIDDFKASKGWIMSFICRNKLDSLYHII